MISKKNICIKALLVSCIFTSVCIIGTKDASAADISEKQKQGVTLKTSQLKSNKVIVSPVTETVSTPDGKSITLSRGAGDLGNQMICYAYEFMGTPYVFGADGPNTFDCSGFTKYVFAHFGLDLPRTSQEQRGAGASISRENLKIGDLVFFNTYTTLGHVGIYIGGDDFIHASSGGVKVSSLSEDYYSSRYAGGTRLFN